MVECPVLTVLGRTEADSGHPLAWMKPDLCPFCDSRTSSCSTRKMTTSPEVSPKSRSTTCPCETSARTMRSKPAASASRSTLKATNYGSCPALTNTTCTVSTAGSQRTQPALFAAGRFWFPPTERVSSSQSWFCGTSTSIPPFPLHLLPSHVRTRIEIFFPIHPI